MHFAGGVPEGFEPDLNWLRELPIPVYGLPADLPGWRLLGDSGWETGQEPGRAPEVAYSVQLRHVSNQDPPVASLFVETSTQQVPMGDQYLPQGLLNGGDPFDWHVLIDGRRVDVQAVRGSNNVTLAKGVVGDVKVTILGGNWPTHEALDLVTITDLSPYIEERKRIIGF